MRTSFAALLAGVLIVFAAGCAGDEEKNEEAKEDQTTTEQDAQQTGEETTEERTKADGEARAGEVTLEMDGEQGTEFSGFCTVGGEETEISGQVPETFTLELGGERLECEIDVDDDMEIVFTDGEGTRSVQRISEGTLNITYEDGSISSFSTSSSGGGQVSSSQVVSSSQSSSSSVSISP